MPITPPNCQKGWTSVRPGHMWSEYTQLLMYQRIREKKLKGKITCRMAFFLIAPIYSMEQENVFFMAFSQDPGKQEN